MEGLIPLVYRAVAEYRKGRQLQPGSCRLQLYTTDRSPSPSRPLLLRESVASPASLTVVLMSPLLRSSTSRRHCAGLKRCDKSCRLRWLNYLRPNSKHGDFTEEEEHIICSLYISIGSRWSIIAAQLPGRTDNDIKNYWNTKLKKKLLGKRAPSRRMRGSLDAPTTSYTSAYLAAATASGSTGGNVNGAAATSHATLSSSALERIQLYMRLQGLYNAFGCGAMASNAPPSPWPKLESPTDAVAMTFTAQQHPQSLVAGHTMSAAEADELNASPGATYMQPAPGSFEERSKLGFF